MKMNINSVVHVLATLFALIAVCWSKKLTVSKDNCEVCVGVVDKLIKSLDSSEITDETKVRSKFEDFCKKVKDNREHKFCYYIGGLETSAYSVLLTMVKPITRYLPAVKVCQKLYDQDNDICDIKYEKKIDLVNTNFRKMRVKELKKILTAWNEDCRGCAEKSDYIKRIMDLMPDKDPEAFAARQKKEEL